MHSPRIDQISWGRMRVEGAGAGKDFKLWPGGAREWDWTETDTHHDPGIQPADLRELLDHGAKIVVLSRGMLRRLRAPVETRDWLESEGVETIVAETRQAVKAYNRLAAEGKPVGGLFHSTC